MYKRYPKNLLRFIFQLIQLIRGRSKVYLAYKYDVTKYDIALIFETQKSSEKPNQSKHTPRHSRSRIQFPPEKRSQKFLAYKHPTPGVQRRAMTQDHSRPAQNRNKVRSTECRKRATRRQCIKHQRQE